MNTVAIIGMGHVGVATAYSLALQGGIGRLILVDHDLDRARGHALDLQHALAIANDTLTVEASTLDTLSHPDIAIITAGKKGAPGQSRLSLLGENKKIIEEIVPLLVKANSKILIVMVTNPVDVLTYFAWKISGLSRNQVFGTGTILDTTRFRSHIGELLQLSPTSIHAYILGEHGDSSVPIWSSAQVGSKPLLSFPQITMEVQENIYLAVKEAAQRIIKLKGYTDLGIGACATLLVQSIIADAKRVHPISAVLDGEYGCNDVSFGVPAVIGRNGAESILEVPVSEEEGKKLQLSAEILKQKIQEL